MGSIGDDIRQVFSRGNSSSVQLILVNLFVFIGLFLFKLLLSVSENTRPIAAQFEENLWLSASIPEFINRPWTLLTFGFINSSVIQLLFNSIALYWFGLLVQDFIGSKKLINIYLLGYVFAGLFYLLAYNLINMSNTTVTMSSLVTGSNAAVYAVMFATVTLIPDYEFYFFRRFYIKIKYIALAFLVFSFFTPTSGLLNLGGAFLGYLYIKMLRLGIDLGAPIESVFGWFGSLGKPKPKRTFKMKKYSHSAVGKKGGFSIPEEEDYVPDQEEVDALLDKISMSGYESLSKKEKERLYRASKS
ncbi:rhomboid family intramembrane serine protease [Jiulongibacter sp. NS-SX5]|uniref:rhomboid family intramembrane serine protease n=1 Tax=Jiulongibacter sp. NS-SX5 TaxID=3463854 RepID=UPI0040598E0E